MCDISWDDTTGPPVIRTIGPNSCDTNSYLRYEINDFHDIQLGVLYLNVLITFDNTNKDFFKCLLKFEYEDIN